MLIASTKRYVPTAVNMMVLQGLDGMYYYMHRSLYDQCIILRDQYINLLPSFYKLFGLEDTHPEVCDIFMEEVPEPLDILGPFLSLIAGCEELEDIEEMCGALSSMSMTIDFRKMFKVPAQVRQSIKFSLSVREEFRVQWDRFFLETPLLEDVSFSASTRPQASTETFAVVAEGDDMQGVVFTGGDDYTTDDLLAQFESFSAQSPASAEIETVDDKPKAKSGFDMLRGF